MRTYPSSTRILKTYQIYVIDVAPGGDIPRKGGLGITRSDLLVVKQVDLAPYVEVDLERMATDVRAARGALPFPAWGGPGHHHT